MDWYAWLCRAGLHPDVAFEYALLFARNELGAADVRHLDHEFLLSMGVAVAKHRLEILKLAWRDRRSRARAHPAALARLLLGRVARYVRSLVRRDEDGSTALVLVPSQLQHPDVVGRSPCAGGVSRHKQQRRGGKALRRAKSEPNKAPAPRASIGGRAAAAVHAVGDVESGDGDEMVRWDRLFQDLKPN